MTVTCTAKEFCGHKDPYTGEELVVEMYVLPTGDVRYRMRNGYDVSSHYPTMEEATAAWSRVDGVTGMRDSAHGFTCAWTGRRLQPAMSDDPPGWHFTGGFATGLFYTREEILVAFARMEGRAAPSSVVTRVVAARDAPPPPLFHEHEPDDEALKRAESLVKTARRTMGAAPESPVSMSVPRGKPGKGKARAG